MLTLVAVDLEQRDEAVKALRAQITRATGLSQMPLHVIFRMAAVVGHDPLVFLDGDVDIDREQRSQTLSGTLVGFTDRVGLRVILDGVGVRPNSDAAATVSVEAWSRRTLTGLALRRHDNTDDTWVSAQHLLWPRGAHVQLTYRDMSEPLVLPLSNVGGDELGSLVPTLTADLSG